MQLVHYIKSFLKRKEVKEFVVTVVIAALITGGLWFGLVMILQTSNPLAQVESGSMKPTLEVGDLVVVKGIDSSQIKVGDIILFKSPSEPEKLIVHRVVKIHLINGELYFETKGDNNPVSDYVFWGWLVPAKNVVGIVIYRIQYIGWVFLFLRSPLGYVVIIVLILTIIYFEFASGKTED
jgi:signal peptidase